MSRRPLLLWIAGGALVILVIWQIVVIITRGQLIATSNDHTAVIELSKIDNNGGKVTVATEEDGALSKHLAGGDYTVTATTKAFTVSREVHITSRKTIKVALNSIQRADLEPVSPVAARSVQATSSTLTYLEDGSQVLYRLDVQNNLQTLDKTHSLVEIKWADASFGVGMDAAHNFFTIEGAVIKPIALPFATNKPNDHARITFDVSPNHGFFVSHGSAIYGNAGGHKLTKLYTAAVDGPLLAASNQRLAIMEPPGDLQFVRANPKITVVDATSGKVLAQESLGSNFGKWSGDGKYLVAYGDTTGKVVDASLKTVVNLPQVSTGLSNVVWSGHQLYYVTSNQLWVYDITTKLSQAVANTPPGQNLSEIAASSDGAYIYLSAGTIGNSIRQTLFRLGIKGQPKPPNYVYQLPVILPNSAQACSLSYINFTVPTILGYAGSDPDTTCKAAAESLFGIYGITASLLNYSFSSPDTTPHDVGPGH